MKTKKNSRLRREQEKKECERCGFTFLKVELIRQNGILVCEECTDAPSYADVRDDE